MHNLIISKAVLDRVLARRGRLHSVESLDPQRTALVVIDMQYAYLAEGQPGYAKFGGTIIQQINDLCSAFRSVGGQVIWLRNTIAKDGDRAWPTYRHLRTDQSWKAMATALAKGSIGHDISAQ